MLGIGCNDVTNSYVMAVVLVVLIAGMPEPEGGGSAPLPHLIIFGRPVNPITIRGSRFCPHFKIEKI